jgi:DnaJ-class molecular chaperone
VTYTEFQDALQVLGLREWSTIREIRGRHRELVKRYHPDSGGDPHNDQIALINAAYRIVNDYLESYRYSFSEEEFYTQNPEERMRRQFMDSPLWGGAR